MGLRALKRQLRKAGYPKAAVGLERENVSLLPAIVRTGEGGAGIRFYQNERGQLYAMLVTSGGEVPICDEVHVYNPRPVGPAGRPPKPERKRVNLSLDPEVHARIVALIGDAPVATWCEQCVVDCLDATEAR